MPDGAANAYLPINISQINSNGPPLNIICISIEVQMPERTRIQASTSPVIHCGSTITGSIHQGVSFNLKLLKWTNAKASTDRWKIHGNHCTYKRRRRQGSASSLLASPRIFKATSKASTNRKAAMLSQDGPEKTTIAITGITHKMARGYRRL